VADGVVGVIGLGQMGSQIALLSALRGFETRVYDVAPGAAERFLRWTDSYLRDRTEKGKIEPGVADQTRSRLSAQSSVKDCAGPADFVVEAVAEDVRVKRAVFTEADRATAAAHLFTNSSTIVSSKLIDGLVHPERVCNVHFFNPALVMDLVEVVRGLHTSDATITAAMDFARSLGKTPVLLKKEVRGFAVNRVLDSIWRESLYLVENEVISVEDLDTAITKGLGHPMGPFRLMDLVGIDLVYSTQMDAYKETGDERLAPSHLLVTKIENGELGKKSGRGWYSYQQTT